MPRSAIVDMFGVDFGRPASRSCYLPAAEAWLPAEKLHREFQVVGFYLSAHPLDEYKAALEKMRVQNWAEFSAAVKRGATAGRLAGTVTAKQERKTRTGNKMGVVQFSDMSGQFEAVLFSERLAQYRDRSKPANRWWSTVSAEDRPEGINLRIQTVLSRSTIWRARYRRRCASILRDAGPLSTLASQSRSERRGAGQLRRDQGRRAGRGRDRSCRTAIGLAADRLGDAGIPGVVEVELV